MEQYTTSAARQELALREAAKTGNRHMRRKGAKVFRNVPPPSPWFVLDHPVFGTMGIRPTADTKLDVKLPKGLPDDERVAVIEWGVAELKAMASGMSESEAECPDDGS